MYHLEPLLLFMNSSYALRFFLVGRYGCSAFGHLDDIQPDTYRHLLQGTGPQQRQQLQWLLELNHLSVSPSCSNRSFLVYEALVASTSAWDLGLPGQRSSVFRLAFRFKVFSGLDFDHFNYLRREVTP